MAKPFLKWPGGKAQLLDRIQQRIPPFSGFYYEPFIGGGALFFSLKSQGIVSHAVLGDANTELIETYKCVRDRLPELVDRLRALDEERIENCPKAHYYKIRSLDRATEYASLDPIQKAARFIYLNKTCYNGLYRVNRSGQFNSPIGKYKKPKICDRKKLERACQLLQRTQLRNTSFEKTLKEVRPGDFVYLDPPYIPLNKTSSFTQYSADGFSADLQVRLRDLCLELTARGVKFLLSNSSSKQTLALYDRPEFKIGLVAAKRNINSNGSKRQPVLEVLVRNYA